MGLSTVGGNAKIPVKAAQLFNGHASQGIPMKVPGAACPIEGEKIYSGFFLLTVFRQGYGDIVFLVVQERDFIRNFDEVLF